MLDMSNAFDTVHRVKLFTIVRAFLEDDELHIQSSNRKCYTESEN